MNLDKLNKWLTLVANIGVLAGIVFLGFEIKQNNTLAQAAAYQEIGVAAASAWDNMAHDRQFVSLQVKAPTDDSDQGHSIISISSPYHAGRGSIGQAIAIS